MKKVINLKLIIVLLCFYFIFKCNKVYALSYYTIDRYDIEATILNNGNMRVVEEIEYSFKDDLKVINKDILFPDYLSIEVGEKMPSMHMPTEIENIKVYISDNLIDENLYDVNFFNDSCSFSIHFDAKINSSVCIKYEYVLKDIAVKYENVGVIYWNFIAKNLQTSVNCVNISIGVEENSDNLKVYPHSYCNISNIEYKDNFAKFNVYDLGLQSGIDAKIIFDNHAISNAKKVVEEDYDLIEMASMENKIWIQKLRYKISDLLYIIFDIFMGVSYIILIVIILRKKNLGKTKNVEYKCDVLKNLSFEEYNLLYGESTIKTNFFITTLLELVNKKYLKLEVIKDEEYKKNNKEVYEYYLSLHSNTNFTKLTQYQRLIINYLFNKEVNSGSVDKLVERKILLKERLRQLSRDYKLVKLFAKECGKIDSVLKKKIFRKANTKNVNNYINVSIIVIILLMIINTFVVSPIELIDNLAPVIISLYFLVGYIILLLPFTHIDIIKEEYMKEYNDMQSLKKYILNYAIIKEKYPISFDNEKNLLDLLSFSCIFGVAQNFSKELKETLLSRNDEMYDKYPYFHMCINFSGLSSAISTATGSNSGGGYGVDDE